MKEYKEVVNERFNQESQNDSIYAPTHPVGRYLKKYLFEGMLAFLSWYKKQAGAFDEKKILDLGCGDGKMLQFFTANGFNSKNAKGIDLSEKRIELAKEKVTDICFHCADAINFDLDEKDFDLIMAFDLYSHIITEDEIVLGLKNIANHLKNDGHFLWYDIYSDNHFFPPENADSWGFNKNQMIDLANKAGFKLVYNKPFFKRFFNKYQSVYQVTRFPAPFVRFMEKILPGPPCNMLLVFMKR